MPLYLRMILVAVGIFILTIFIVDKLVLQPPDDSKVALGLSAELLRHNVRHVTVPAHSVTIELNDGKTRTYTVPADTDLWPAIRRSGADVSISRAPDTQTSPLGFVFQFVPFVIMALLLIFILRTVRARQT
jgi:ATP-dependent Zn protease